MHLLNNRAVACDTPIMGDARCGEHSGSTTDGCNKATTIVIVADSTANSLGGTQIDVAGVASREDKCRAIAEVCILDKFVAPQCNQAVRRGDIQRPANGHTSKLDTSTLHDIYRGECFDALKALGNKYICSLHSYR